MQLPPETQRHLCVVIAGELAYLLTHNEPWENEALGEMVRGTDIDIIIIHDAILSGVTDMIEHAMKEHKFYFLRHPEHRQELDYICKSKKTMFNQYSYSDIHEKIASKIA